MTGYPTPFAKQPVDIRIAILQSWGIARTPIFRQLNRLLTTLIKQNWAKTSATLGRVLGFPRVPVHGSVGKGFEFEFIQMPPGDGPETLDTDVVIVGSGCGAGVCAKNLAEAGHRVIIVEKSYYWPPEHLPMKDTEGFSHLFMNGGSIISDESCVSVAAGKCCSSTQQPLEQTSASNADSIRSNVWRWRIRELVCFLANARICAPRMGRSRPASFHISRIPEVLGYCLRAYGCCN